MNRRELEHVLRAAAAIADVDEFVVIGSQSILGQFPDAPADLRVSTEVDLYPRYHPDRADLIDGSIGELSPFHATFGYYAQGVGPTTAVLPANWEERLFAVKGPATHGATGWCLEVHDLLLSKYVAGREKDRVFVRSVIAHGLAQRGVLLDRLKLMPLDDSVRTTIAERIDADCSDAGSGGA